MPRFGKRLSEAASKYDKHSTYPITEAIELAKSMATAKFDESIDAVFKLGIDPKKADQLVRGTVALPHGTGKTVRVAVFAPADRHKEALDAGADLVGGEELVEELAGGRALDFDLTISTPDMMAHVGKLGRVLGPRVLMPNPKAGTVTADIGKAVSEFKGGRIEYRNDRHGNIHSPIGKASFEVKQLVENLAALVLEVERAKPASSKGRYFQGITVSSTMGPGIKVEAGKIEDITGIVK